MAGPVHERRAPGRILRWPVRDMNGMVPFRLVMAKIRRWYGS